MEMFALRNLTLICLMLFAGILHAEEQYWIGDRLWLGMYADETLQSPSIATLPSGTELTLLEEKGENVKIETNNGQQGWVRKRYLVNEPPYKVQIDQLQTELEALKNQQPQVEEIPETEIDIEAIEQPLKQTIAQLKNENQRLNNQKPSNNKNIYIVFAVGLVSIAIIFYLIGGARVKSRLRQRFHGMNIE